MSQHHKGTQKNRDKEYRPRAPKKGTQKNKEKEHNPWEPKPLKPMESQSQDFISLEGNILNRDFVATNIEIDIRECTRSHCQLHIYNTPYSEEETLSKLNEAASHIIHKLIRFSPEEHCYIVEATLS